MPICSKCDNSFPIWVKIDDKPRNLSNRKYCLECSAFGNHNTRQLHLTPQKRKKLDRNHEYQKKYRNERKKKLVEQKGNKCCLCGYNTCINALQFHHVDPSTKEFPLSKAYLCRKTWSTLIAELDKTKCLCANCHVEVESGMHKKDVKKWQTNLMVSMV